MVLKLAFANVKRSYKDFALYFCTLVLGVAVFYAFNSIQDQQAVLALSEQQGQIIEMTGMLITGVSVFIGVILGFLVVYANRFLIKRRNGEFALYELLGMPKRSLMKLMAYENLLIGCASLLIGLVLGFLISQLLLQVTSLLFVAHVTGFGFFFSSNAALYTVGVFAVIFVVALIMSTGYVAKARLITLLQSNARNDTVPLRSLVLSFILFVLSLVIIVLSYQTLLNNGFEMNDEFARATALVSIGTFLFFYAASGFLIRILQAVKPLYWKGLNAFTIQQISSRITTTFASLGVICLALFLALTSVSTGVSVAIAMQQGLAKQTAYSATVYAYPTQELEEGGAIDMARALSDATHTCKTTSWDSLVAQSTQVDLHESGLTIGEFEDIVGLRMDATIQGLNPSYRDTSLLAVSVSQVNRALQMGGKNPIDVEPDSAVLYADSSIAHDYLKQVGKTPHDLTLYGHTLTTAPELETEPYITESTPTQVIVLIVPDGVIPENATPATSLLDVQFVDDGAESAWLTTMDEILKKADSLPFSDSAIIGMYETRQEVFDQSVSFSTIVSYLAIYIGFVLVVACAAILAIQQLMNALENKQRYSMLYKLGAEEKQLKASLRKQIGIVFAAPLLLAVAHTVCAMSVLVPFIQLFGAFDIAQTAAIVGVAFVLVYGAYYALTYFTAYSYVRPE